MGFRARPAGPPARPPASQPSGRRPGQLPASPGASHSNPPKSNQRQGNPTKSNEIQVNPEKSNQIHGFLLKSWILIEITDNRKINPTNSQIPPNWYSAKSWILIENMSVHQNHGFPLKSWITNKIHGNPIKSMEIQANPPQIRAQTLYWEARFDPQKEP